MLEAKVKNTGASVLQKKSLRTNFSCDLQNFNYSKTSAGLESRTAKFSRTSGFEAKDFKMCPRGRPRGRPRGQERPQGLHL